MQYYLTFAMLDYGSRCIQERSWFPNDHKTSDKIPCCSVKTFGKIKKKEGPDVVQCITCNKALLICDSISLVGSTFWPQSDTCIQNRHVLFM